jgi:prolyl 4-hydroxylase
MGEARTPILLDHNKLVAVDNYLPCHFHNQYGVRVTSLKALVDSPRRDDADNKMHLYAVPAGRVFMFAASHIGQIIPLPHVTGGDPTKPVYLEVMSLSPRVFDLHNFFTREESADLVDRALKETRESHRIKRSSTGASGYNINPTRTSESGYDTSGATAVAIKKRCFDVLGFDEYIESHSDGLQMLRYNVSKAYNSHMDYIDGNDQLEHDYDSSHKGGNRYATILLYMTDLDEKDGGETCFPNAWPVGQAEEDRISDEDVSAMHFAWGLPIVSCCQRTHGRMVFLRRYVSFGRAAR